MKLNTFHLSTACIEEQSFEAAVLISYLAFGSKVENRH